MSSFLKIFMFECLHVWMSSWWSGMLKVFATLCLFLKNLGPAFFSSRSMIWSVDGRSIIDRSGPDDQADSNLEAPTLPVSEFTWRKCLLSHSHPLQNHMVWFIRYESYQFARSNEIVHELFMNFIKWSSSDLGQVWSSLTTSIWKRWFSDWLTDWIHTRMAVPEIHTPEFNTEVDSRFWIRKPKPSLLV